MTRFRFSGFPCAPRRSMAWRRLASAGAALLMSATASAEGALRFFDCTIERVCDEVGVCENGGPEVSFRMEPIAVEADGSGEYTVSYGDVNASVHAFSEAGPFVWTAGDERHALLVSSDAHFLWHTLTLEDGAQARVAFMACGVRY